jgi:hypothetical protein
LSNSLDPLSQPRSSGFTFKLPPEYEEDYPEIVRETVFSFIKQPKKTILNVKTINSLLRLFKKLVDNELGKTLTDNQSIDSTMAHFSLNSEISTPSSISNKMKMFICNNCIHVLMKLGIIMDIYCTPIEVICVSNL